MRALVFKSRLTQTGGTHLIEKIAVKAPSKTLKPEKSAR
jgi:hypothetical protein